MPDRAQVQRPVRRDLGRHVAGAAATMAAVSHNEAGADVSGVGNCDAAGGRGKFVCYRFG